MVTLIEENNLFTLHQKAISGCPVGEKVSNLILTGNFPISEIHTKFVTNNLGKAMEWLKFPCPENLEFNHGDYIEKYLQPDKNGVDFLISELKQKSDTNRACWSLLTMEDLVQKDIDKSIPSFMVLQVGLSHDKKILEVCAYYRALEVYNFLPINIGEACIVIKKIIETHIFPLSHFSLTIHAFNAYNDPEFSCLEKAEIDYIDEMEIMLNLTDFGNGIDWAIELLEGKRDLKESRINPVGINNFLEGMQKYNFKYFNNKNIKSYDKKVLEKLQKISDQIARHNEIKAKSSYSKEPGEIYKQIKLDIDEVIKILNR